MIGGYIVGILAGGTMSYLNMSVDVSIPFVENAAMIIFGALATSLAMFVMVVTKTEHPPAAALALGLVLNEWDLLTIGVVMAGIVGLSIFKRMVLPLLMDLL